MKLSCIDRGSDSAKRKDLKFHAIHGKNIKRDSGGGRVDRTASFCDGIVFSDRPIAIDERVSLRQSTVSSSGWSGVLRVGVTSVDPASLRSDQLPKFACPTLDQKPGYWIRALPDRHAKQGNLVEFFVSSNGMLRYSINGENKGILITGVATAKPLWVIVDVYGTAKAVEFERSRDGRALESEERAQQMRELSRRANFDPMRSQISTGLRDRSRTSEERERTRQMREISRRADSSPVRRVASPTPPPRSSTVPDPATVTGRKPSLLGAISLFGFSLGGGGSSRNADDRRPAVSHSTVDGRRRDMIPSPPRIPAPETPVARPRALRPPTARPPPVTRQAASSSSSDAVTAAPPASRTSPLVTPSSSSSMTSSSIRIRPAPELTSAAGRSLMAETRISTTVRAARDSDAAIYRRIQEFSETTERIVRERRAFVEANPPILSTPASSRALMTSSSMMNRSPTSSSIGRTTMAKSGGYLSQTTSSSMSTRRSPPSAAAATARNQTMTSSSSTSSRISPQRTASSHFSSNQTTSSTGAANAQNQRTPVYRSFPGPMTSSTSASTAQNQMTPASRFSSGPMTSSTSVSTAKKQTPSPSRGYGSRDDCSICMEAPVNSVIYSCGHMCMCYECALRIKVLGRGCPICREPMKDVIRTFKA